MFLTQFVYIHSRKRFIAHHTGCDGEDEGRSPWEGCPSNRHGGAIRGPAILARGAPVEWVCLTVSLDPAVIRKRGALSLCPTGSEPHTGQVPNLTEQIIRAPLGTTTLPKPIHVASGAFERIG
jgi:hypothetical protein